MASFKLMTYNEKAYFVFANSGRCIVFYILGCTKPPLIALNKKNEKSTLSMQPSIPHYTSASRSMTPKA